jgi:hypothetical protein
VRLANRKRPGNSSYRNLGQLRTATRRTGNPAALHGLGRLFDLEHFIELLEETRYVVYPAKDTHLFALELPDSDAAIVRDDADVCCARTWCIRSPRADLLLECERCVVVFHLRRALSSAVGSYPQEAGHLPTSSRRNQHRSRI